MWSFWNIGHKTRAKAFWKGGDDFQLEWTTLLLQWAVALRQPEGPFNQALIPFPKLHLLLEMFSPELDQLRTRPQKREVFVLQYAEASGCLRFIAINSFLNGNGIRVSKPAGAGRLWDELLHSFSGDFSVCSGLEVGRQLYIGLITALQRGELQPTLWWRDDGGADGTLISLLCLQISCVREAVMWCEVWEMSYVALFIYTGAFVWQTTSISHVFPMRVKTLANLQTQWAWMCCKPPSK